MYNSIERVILVFALILFFSNTTYGRIASKEPKSLTGTISLQNKTKQKTLDKIDQMIIEKRSILKTTQKSDTLHYISLYDKIVELTILKNRLLTETDRVNLVDNDQTCDLASSYEEVEFIKTEYYKTPFNENVARTLKNIAMLYEQCHPPMAEQYLKSYLKIKEHLYSRESKEAAEAHDLLGDYYRISLAHFEKAVEEYKKAIDIRKKLYGNDDIRITENFGRLALSLYFHGDKKCQAEQLLMKSIKLRKKDARNPRLPLYRAYMIMGYYLYLKDEKDKCLNYYQKAKNNFFGDKQSDYRTIQEARSCLK